MEARTVKALAIPAPQAGPNPLLFRTRCCKGVWLDRKATSSGSIRAPKALSERFMDVKKERSRAEVRIAVRDLGISSIRRPV